MTCPPQTILEGTTYISTVEIGKIGYGESRNISNYNVYFNIYPDHRNSKDLVEGFHAINETTY